VNLKKPSLKVVPVPEEPGKFTVQFQFDAAAPCWVSVFFLAREEPAAACRLTASRVDPPARVARPAGLAQTFTWEELFDPSRYNIDDMVHAEGEQYPLCVRLETIPSAGAAGAASSSGDAARVLPEPAGCSLPAWVQSQTTYASLQPVEGGWAVRVVKQRIWVDGVSYELQEIYGIENCATGNAEEDATAGKECVVCLSEPRDTTVLPCRHMCMCSGCARMLRHQTNRCPICRTPVESLLEIKVERRPAAPRPAA
jgi:E3 ubiquitin-protein ligase MGRN1